MEELTVVTLTDLFKKEGNHMCPIMKDYCDATPQCPYYRIVDMGRKNAEGVPEHAEFCSYQRAIEAIGELPGVISHLTHTLVQIDLGRQQQEKMPGASNVSPKVS